MDFQKYTYGFLSEKDLEKSKINKETIENAIKIINPLGDEFRLMRPTTIPSMMQNISWNNNKKNQNVKLFDISRNYRNINGQVEKGEVPLQEKHINNRNVWRKCRLLYIKKEL